jgi:hypothetical protein
VDCQGDTGPAGTSVRGLERGHSRTAAALSRVTADQDISRGFLDGDQAALVI